MKTIADGKRSVEYFSVVKVYSEKQLKDIKI